MENVDERLLNMRDVVDKNHLQYKHARWVTEQEGALIKDCISIVGARSYVESGTANGYSALWASSGLPEDGKVYTFDPCDRPKVWDEDFACPSLMPKIEFIQDIFENIGKHDLEIEHPVVFFIDGDHGRLAVRRDWDVIRPLLEPGDLVIFHDLNETPVYRTWDQIRKHPGKYTTTYEFLTRRWVGALLYNSSNAKLQALDDTFEPDSFWAKHYPEVLEQWKKR